MKISDILRAAADAIDSLDKPAATTTTVQDEILSPASYDEIDRSDSSAMVPPLQQKHELLKKVSDVSNDADEFDKNEEDGDAAIAALKSLAGVASAEEITPSQVAVHIVSDDHESD